MATQTIEARLEEEEEQAERFDDAREDSSLDPSEQEFRDAALQIVVQRNDFFLPNLIDMLRTHKSMEVSPYYQRRARWDISRKSRLIESFLVNIPVPPIFLYENDFATYEVMDGQQRVSAILEYFENDFALRGLEILRTLVGKRFNDLPHGVQAGLRRRSLSAIILLKESTPSHESRAQLRRFVFQRLNTGGVRLNAQEVRNAVYAGSFNDLLLELSRHELFTTMWDIPPFEPNENTKPSLKLQRNIWYRGMRDVELVLRVFGLMEPENIVGGMRRTLDNAMMKYSSRSESELRRLGDLFVNSLKLAHAIGGDDAFRLPSSSLRRGRLSASLFDAIMVALMRKSDQSEQIMTCASDINSVIGTEMKKLDFHDLIIGRANTREATKERSRYVERLIESVLVK